MNILKVVLSVAMISACLSACSGKYFKTEAKDGEGLKQIGCIAIFPFANRSGSAEAGGIITDLVSSTVSSGSLFRIVPFSDVERGVALERIDTDSGTDPVKGCELGRRLNSTAVLLGGVNEYGYVRETSEFTVPKVAFTLAIYRTKDCKLLWEGRVGETSSSTFKGSLSALTMNSVDKVMKRLSRDLGERVLDFRYKCGPQKFEEKSRCARGEGGGIDFEKCPEAIPLLRLGREKVSLEGDELIFRDRIEFMPAKNMIMISSYPTLEALINFLNKNNIRRIRIESYAVSAGDDASGTQLDRAGSIRKFLLNNGLKNTRVDTANFQIRPSLVEGKEIMNLRFVVIE